MENDSRNVFRLGVFLTSAEEISGIEVSKGKFYNPGQEGSSDQQKVIGSIDITRELGRRQDRETIERESLNVDVVTATI